MEFLGRSAAMLDTTFATDVASIYFQAGSTLHAARVTSIIHNGATYRKNMWAASSKSELFFLEDMLQVDGMAKGGASFVAGQVFVKVYVFSFQQLRAKVAANSITVSFARILQLLQFQHEK
eukprot:1459842-Pleurochrysis_carterae.AAC.1